MSWFKIHQPLHSRYTFANASFGTNQSHKKLFTRFAQCFDEPVQIELRAIMASHGRLVDSIKQRSVADPWVIAFAKSNGSTVVTKETPAGNDGRRIKIPDVCEALNIEWIDDFELARRLGIRFKAAVEHLNAP